MWYSVCSPFCPKERHFRAVLLPGASDWDMVELLLTEQCLNLPATWLSLQLAGVAGSVLRPRHQWQPNNNEMHCFQHIMTLKYIETCHFHNHTSMFLSKPL